MDIEKLIERLRDKGCEDCPHRDTCRDDDTAECVIRLNAATALSTLQAENKHLNKIVCSIPTTPDSGRTVSQYDKEMSMCAYLDDLEAENEKLQAELNRCREKNAGLALALLTECAPNPDCLGDDEWRAIKTELEQVKQERDAAIDCIYKIMEEENK